LKPIFNANRLESRAKSPSRISEELHSLREKIVDLERLESELVQAEQALSNPSARLASMGRPPDQIQAEIEARLGFFPPFLVPALAVPEVLENLWHQTQAAYFDNPIPERIKECLSAKLARHCRSAYPIVVHCCNLHALGMKGSEVFALLGRGFRLTASYLDQTVATLQAVPEPLDGWPDSDSDLEQLLISACGACFLEPQNAFRCNVELRRLLGSVRFAHVTALLAYAKTFHIWVEAHPEIIWEGSPQLRERLAHLLQEEPRLGELIHAHFEEPGQEDDPSETEKALRASEERYRELFENANDFVYTHDLDGTLTSLNKAAERITGYTRADALRMKFTDFVASDYVELARRMIQRQIADEIPATFELEILAKDGHRVALGISTRLIFREGRAIALQGIARDITERKKTEEALQQANQKLEAWVDELEQRTREMALLNEMGDMLRACLTTDEAYRVIVRVAEQIFPVQVGALYIITPSRNLVESVAMWGNASLAERIFAPDECWALRRGRIHWVEDANAGLICKHLRHPSTTGYLCVPMMAQSEALGVLHLTQPENNKMTEAKQRLAVDMAEHIAMALSNLKLHETLRSQSIRDPLTGLFNRRFMEESLELEVRRAARNQRPLGVIMLDLDHFKHFNDTFGHEAGDTLLRELGVLLQGNIRGEDIACRYGGEEFTLILPEGNLEITQQRAEFLREAIKRLDVQHRSRPLGRITASMGVAIFPRHARTGKALLEAADGALYRSKDEGRDRVTTAR
jgi:diguanylate cyclase (GGDEF)-like protein/PAS domain S-box-containing protein